MHADAIYTHEQRLAKIHTLIHTYVSIHRRPHTELCTHGHTLKHVDMHTDVLKHRQVHTYVHACKQTRIEKETDKSKEKTCIGRLFLEFLLFRMN